MRCCFAFWRLYTVARCLFYMQYFAILPLPLPCYSSRLFFSFCVANWFQHFFICDTVSIYGSFLLCITRSLWSVIYSPLSLHPYTADHPSCPCRCICSCRVLFTGMPSCLHCIYAYLLYHVCALRAYAPVFFWETRVLRHFLPATLPVSLFCLFYWLPLWRVGALRAANVSQIFTSRWLSLYLRRPCIGRAVRVKDAV